MQTLVIKIGTHLVTDKNGDFNCDLVKQIVKDIIKLKKEKINIVLVSSGAVASGRNLVKEFQAENFKLVGNQKNKIIKEQILASVGQPEIMAFYKKKFHKHQTNCAQILVTRVDFANKKRYLNLRNVTLNLINLGIIPIFNENDVLSKESLSFSENDQLSGMVSGMVLADKLIILTNVDGVYDKNPETKDANLINQIDDVNNIINQIDTSKSQFGKGGMKSKLLTAQLVTNLGIPLHIANGLKPDILSQIVLKKKNLGTFFPARRKKTKPIKTWIAAGAKSKGQLKVSNYLADILKKKRAASILFVGIERVLGNFQKGDIIEITDTEGVLIGRGQARHDSAKILEEVKKIKNQPLKKIKFLEDKIAVHYNQFAFV
jgi:glutamate 5-kinase